MAAIAASILEFGFNNPVLIDAADGIIAGHGRVLAAQQLGLATVPVVVLGHLTETQRRAYLLADNRLAELAGWDEALLADELRALAGLQVDLGVLGFDAAEVDRLLTGATSDPAEDEAPMAPETPTTRPGDLWELGPHRLLCGDATVAADVERLLGGDEPPLMVTDPPYGVAYDPLWRREAAKAGKIRWGIRRTGAVPHDETAAWGEAYRLFRGAVAYIWHAGVRAGDVGAQLVAAGLELRAQIVWVKQHFTIGRGHYHWQHEPCWYAVRKGCDAGWCGDRTQATVWSINRAIGCFTGDSEAGEASTNHATQKPVECMRRPIANHTARGALVYDPFVGSGTTIIAAETTERIARAVDIEPVYVDVAVLRWQTFTGKPATLADDGRSFAEVATARAVGAAPPRRRRAARHAG